MVRTCVLKTDGINCDVETAFAFEQADSVTQTVLVNELKDKRVRLADFQILTIPGGFSYGDDIASGKVLANELVTFLKDEIAEFVASGKPVLGICNGFQVLVQCGLLPGGTLGRPRAALTTNTSGEFECRWVRVRVEKSSCVFLDSFEAESSFLLPVAHKEGKFWVSDEVLYEIELNGQVALRYVNEYGEPVQTYPENPNGSQNAIAGVCDSTRLIFGLMPHPERFTTKTQYPNWRREGNFKPPGQLIFESAVRYAKQNL